MNRVIVNFSCGAASAVAAKISVDAWSSSREVRVVYADLSADEHPDNLRFLDDVERWTGIKIERHKNPKYTGIDDVFLTERYIVGISGAACTKRLKRNVIDRVCDPEDVRVIGYTDDKKERERARKLQERNLQMKFAWVLIDGGISKQDCFGILSNAGIALPWMYLNGYDHNNCFSGDTEFVTDMGTRRLRDAAGETVKVRGVGGGWTEAEIRSFGTQSLMRVTLQRNNVQRKIYATAGHRWLLKQNVSAAKSERITNELIPGDKMRSVFGRLGSTVRPSAFGIAQGITFGDGTRGRTLNTSVTLVLCGKKNQQLLKFFPLSPRQNISTGIEVRDLPRNWKDRPGLDDCQSFLYGWLAGYFAADGCVSDGEYLLHSANRRNLCFARDVAARLGIGCNDIRMAMRTGLGTKPSAIYTLPLIGYTLREDFFLFREHRRSFSVSCPRYPHPWEVVSVSETNLIEEVFCAVVPKGNAFTLDGNILTGNCIGCVKGGMGYWNKIRRDFPAVFAKRAAIQREIGVGFGGGDVQFMLDELDPEAGRDVPEPDIECGVFCSLYSGVLADATVKAATG